ncbi:MAG: hypothetical protein WBW94_09595 [Anaerolineales bacterium]
MDYKFTHFIYPIPERICLSKHFGFYLDNPRTKSEIQEVAKQLENTRKNSYFQLIAGPNNDFSNAEKYILRFRDHFSNIDPYVLKAFRGYKTERILEYVARLWLIIRFDDGGLKEEAQAYRKKLRKEGKQGFIMPEDDHPAIRNEEALKEYGALISLLTYDNSDETYNGHDILMQEDTIMQDDDFWFIFMMFSTTAPHYDGEKLNTAQGYDWFFYPSIKNNLLASAKLLDDSLSQGTAEKLLYMGNLLYLAGQDTHDTKIKILLLTSILELLLTHNPDFNRFNIEDSINKQFQLKVAMLLRMVNPSLNLSTTRENLKKIYSARSSIAHGNFSELSKIEKAAKKKTDLDGQYPLDTIVSNLYVYTKEIIKSYLADKDLVDFLKQA